MQGKNIWCVEIACLICIFLFLPFVSSIRINEVMPHTNNSLGDEWIELYNEDNFTITFSGKIGDKQSNDSISLNITAHGFAIIVDSSIGCAGLNISNDSCISLATIGSGLNDNDEEVYLYENESLISNFSYNENIKNSGNSWQFYNLSWHSCIPTHASENFCNLTNQTSQDTNNQTATPAQDTEAAIYLKLVYDEIRNREVFEVKIKAYNLKDREYEAKIYVALENDNIISETYNEQESRWKSSTYYLNFSEGNGNKSRSFKINVTKKDFEGEAYIKARIRELEKDNIIAEKSEKIEILKRENSENASIITEQEQRNSSITNATNTSIINLNSKDIKSQEISENKTYRTKTQYLKEYGIYLFAGFCVFVIVILIIKKF